MDREIGNIRDIWAKFTTGVAVITTIEEGYDTGNLRGAVVDESFSQLEVHGMTANALCSVSVEPPLLLLSVGISRRSKKLIESKHLSPFTIKAILLKHPDSICHDLRKISYQEELEYLVNSKARNVFIKNLVLNLKTNTLLLFRFVEKHGKLLYDMIKEELNGLPF